YHGRHQNEASSDFIFIFLVLLFVMGLFFFCVVLKRSQGSRIVTVNPRDTTYHGEYTFPVTSNLYPNPTAPSMNPEVIIHEHVPTFAPSVISVAPITPMS